MKATSKEMRKAYKKIDINEVEDVTDDLADLMEDADEINEVGVVAGPDPGASRAQSGQPPLTPPVSDPLLPGAWPLLRCPGH